MKTTLAPNRQRAFALNSLGVLLALLSALLPALVNSRLAALSGAATTQLLAIRDGELAYASTHSGAFSTNLPALGLAAQTNGFTFTVNSNTATAYAFAADLAHWGITNASFQIPLASNSVVVTNVIPGAADARRAALDRLSSNGIVTIQNFFATNSASLRTQSIATASSLNQIFNLFDALDANGDGLLGWNEILSADTNTATPLGAFLNYTRTELSLGAAGEDLATLPGVRFSDIARNTLTVTLPSLLAVTNAPTTNVWPLRGILYSRTNALGVPTVYLCAADGSTDRVLLSNATWPRLSPDGRWLVYHYMNSPTAYPATQQVRVHDLLKGDDTSSDTVILAPLADTYLYEFTADSSIVVLDYGGMVRRPRDNSLPLQVIFNSPTLQAPARNPVTGQFIGANGSVLRLFDFNPANTNLPPNVRTLTGSTNNDQWATWSADGQWIAAYNYNNALTDEYWFKIRPNGSQRTRLSFLPVSSVTAHPNAAWTPDGQWLVVIATVGGTNGLWALATDGSGTMRLLPSGVPAASGYSSGGFVGATTINLPLPGAPVLAQLFTSNTSAWLTNFSISNKFVSFRSTAGTFAKIFIPTDPGFPTDPTRGLYLGTKADAAAGAGLSVIKPGDPITPGDQMLTAVNVELWGGYPTDPLTPVDPIVPADPVRLRGKGRIVGNVFNLGGLVTTPPDPIVPGDPMIPATRIFPGEPIIPGDPVYPSDPMFPAARFLPSDPIVPTDPGAPPDPFYPGDPFRVLTVAGNYFQSSGGALGLVIGDRAGATPKYDQLRVEGVATLSGQLGVALAGVTNGVSTNAYQPQVGDRFDVISAPRIVTENLRLVAPRFGHGLGLVPYLTTNNAGQQVLRLLATNVPVTLTARGVYAASPTNGTLTLDWPINYPTNFTLQSNTNLATTNWTTVTVGTNVTTLTVTNPAAGAKEFFRLKVP